MEVKLAVLLRDYGYRFGCGYIVSVGVRGITTDRIVGRARGIFDAAEQLCLIIRNDEYTARLIRIQNASH